METTLTNGSRISITEGDVRAIAELVAVGQARTLVEAHTLVQREQLIEAITTAPLQPLHTMSPTQLTTHAAGTWSALGDVAQSPFWSAPDR